jgi:hypothetical protein
MLEREDYQRGQVEITCLVRGEDRASLIRELGVKVVVADLADVDVVEAAAAQADSARGILPTALILLTPVQLLLTQPTLIFPEAAQQFWPGSRRDMRRLASQVSLSTYDSWSLYQPQLI